MKILSLILAREGSLRLKDKNLKKINNKTLIERTIEISKKLKKKKEIFDTLLSTDSIKIKKIGIKRKILSPWLRPKKLSHSKSSSAESAIHAINWYEKEHFKINGLLLLQPTSPFRDYKDILKAIKIFIKYKRKIVSVSPIKKHFQDMYEISNTYLKHKVKQKKNNNDLYVCNGYLYLFSIKELKDKKTFYAGNAIPFVIKSNIKSIDIDDKYDLEIARKINEK